MLKKLLVPILFHILVFFFTGIYGVISYITYEKKMPVAALILIIG